MERFDKDCRAGRGGPSREFMSVTTDQKNYIELEPQTGVPIRAWVRGVQFEPEAEKQLRNAAQLPFVFRWIAAMPDVHMGIGATVGSVIPTKGAIIPGGGGSRYRLWNGGGANQPYRLRPP